MAASCSRRREHSECGQSNGTDCFQLDTLRKTRNHTVIYKSFGVNPVTELPAQS